jgi:hypothetical protein
VNELEINSFEGAEPSSIPLSEDCIHFRGVSFNRYKLVVNEEEVLVALVDIISSH